MAAVTRSSSAAASASAWRWLRQVHDDTGHTMLFVTHDQEDALELADRVVVFNAGRIEQVGTPDKMYRHPRSRFVFDFIGRGGRIDGELVAEGDGLSAEVRGLRRIGARHTLELNVAGRNGVIEVDIDAGQPLPSRGQHVRLQPIGGVAFAR